MLDSGGINSYSDSRIDSVFTSIRIGFNSLDIRVESGSGGIDDIGKMVESIEP